jgi:EAL domain-containing protein (putative c-di-GMP-specific phosphodiesterase class I)
MPARLETAMDMVTPRKRPRAKGCGACADGTAAPFAFSMAFQPIVDLSAGRICTYEALVRGPQGQPAKAVLDQVTPANRYAFDQSCRVQAIALASRLGLRASGASLSINFIPGAMYSAETCVRTTVEAARTHAIPGDRLVFELTEDERITDFDHLGRIFSVYRANQFRTAIDDFGAGFAGLSLLANFQPDIVKLDMSLLRDIDSEWRRHAIVQGVVGICRALSVQVVAEGVETAAEVAALRALGISLFQGFVFAHPGFETLPTVAL